MKIGPFGLCMAALAALALAAPTPAQAQFGGLFSRDDDKKEQSSDGCPKGEKRDTGRTILGGILGGIAGGAASRLGVTRWLPMSQFTDQLSTAIACRLDPDEQKQAAEATLAATRGGEDGLPEVGSSASWKSETRDDVSGSSTIVARNVDTEDLDCITVTDVIVVRGEETTANKRMCKPPGSVRYTIVV